MDRHSVTTPAVYGDLVSRLRTLDVSEFRYGGSFVHKEVKGRKYWYHAEKVGGQLRHRYLGPDSEELQAQMAPISKAQGVEPTQSSALACRRRSLDTVDQHGKCEF